MSTIPEAKLAREAEIPYALICTSTDYDAWRAGEEPVTVEEVCPSPARLPPPPRSSADPLPAAPRRPQVIKTLTTNAHLSKKVASEILSSVSAIVEAGDVLTASKGGMQFSVISKKENWTSDAKEKLSWILPYFKD